VKASVDAAVDVENLTVVRGGAPVLDRLSLAVPRGRIVGLLGPSGSGKTTLMRAIVGVQIVKSGTIKVLGVPAGTLRSRLSRAREALRRGVGLEPRSGADPDMG